MIDKNPCFCRQAQEYGNLLKKCLRFLECLPTDDQLDTQFDTSTVSKLTGRRLIYEVKQTLFDYEMAQRDYMEE